VDQEDQLETMLKCRRWARRLGVGLFMACTAAWGGESLVVGFMVSSGNQRTFWDTEIIQKFKAAHPEVQVTQIVRGQEAYKAGFSHMLQNEAVDVAFWFAGERLVQAVDDQLLRPLEDGEVKSALARGFVESTVAATTIRSKVYALPLSYYGWGFYYRKSLFAQLGLQPPTTWAGFLEVGRKLKAAGVAPTAVGNADGWPAAAWFDYLNLRINGLEFHRKLLAGEARFSDPKVREVMAQWKQLQEQGFFLRDTQDKAWDAPLPLLYRNWVGMVLMGGFASAKFPPHLAQDIGFFPFPGIVANVPQYEDAPLDVLVLPKAGKNAEAAHRFLVFLATTGALNSYNARANQLSPLKSFQASALNAGEAAALKSAKAIAFYFDRDARPQLVEPAFKAFKQFMEPPFDTEQAIAALMQAELAIRR
jgi:multiple sugar transport system substrate-binding protein